MKKVWAMMFVIMLGFSIPAQAACKQCDEYARTGEYFVKAAGMLCRGTANLVLAPAEILIHGYEGTLEGTPLLGTIGGTGKGIVWALDRAGRGVWDVATAFAPRYRGAPPVHEIELKQHTG